MLKHLLWIDCAAGALAGVLVIASSSWLSRLEELPRSVFIFTGLINLIYATYSFSLAVRTERSMRSIKLLIFANFAWVPICLMIAFAYRNQANVLGFAHLIGEAIFVGGLAALEWSQRHSLLNRSVP